MWGGKKKRVEQWGSSSSSYSSSGVTKEDIERCKADIYHKYGVTSVAYVNGTMYVYVTSFFSDYNDVAAMCESYGFGYEFK